MEKLGNNTYKLTASQTDFIGIYLDVISKERCDQIIEKMESHIKTNPSKIDKGKHQFDEEELGRKDYHIFAQNIFTEITQDINEALDICIKAYADKFFVLKNMGDVTSNHVKLQMTPPRGGYHVWHCEQNNKSHADRVLAWTLYLNDIPDGEGETEFLWQGVRVKPRAGTVCIFPAAFTHTHRGNPVYSCNKYIATGWYTLDQ